MLKRKFDYPFVTFSIACVLLTGLSGATLAQSQGDSAPSVAEAARRAREVRRVHLERAGQREQLVAHARAQLRGILALVPGQIRTPDRADE